MIVREFYLGITKICNKKNKHNKLKGINLNQINKNIQTDEPFFEGKKAKESTWKVKHRESSFTRPQVNQERRRVEKKNGKIFMNRKFESSGMRSISRSDKKYKRLVDSGQNIQTGQKIAYQTGQKIAYETENRVLVSSSRRRVNP